MIDDLYFPFEYVGNGCFRRCLPPHDTIGAQEAVRLLLGKIKEQAREPKEEGQPG